MINSCSESSECSADMLEPNAPKSSNTLCQPFCGKWCNKLKLSRSSGTEAKASGSTSPEPVLAPAGIGPGNVTVDARQ